MSHSFVVQVIESVRMHPELFYLLEIQEQLLPSAILINSGQSVACEGGTQTVEHLVESFIDPHYEFSEWKLRQRAIKYVRTL